MATREEKKAANRRKLLDAAAQLGAKKGAVATSLDAIAEKAGLTKGAVYSNFTSKEDLLFALAEEFGVAVAADEEWLEKPRPTAESLEHLGESLADALNVASARSWRLTHEILNFALHNNRTRRVIAENWRYTQGLDAELFARSAAAFGETPTLAPEELSVVITALALGLAQVRAIEPKMVPDELFPKAFRLLAG